MSAPGIVRTPADGTPDHERQCENAGCSNVFEPRSARQRFCSDACRLQAFQDRNPTRDLDRRLLRIEQRLAALEEGQRGKIQREALVRR